MIQSREAGLKATARQVMGEHPTDRSSQAYSGCRRQTGLCERSTLVENAQNVEERPVEENVLTRTRTRRTGDESDSTLMVRITQERMTECPGESWGCLWRTPWTWGGEGLESWRVKSCTLGVEGLEAWTVKSWTLGVERLEA